MLDCDCIVLAAGGSRRLGRPKQLLKWDGITLLERVVDAAVQSQCRRVAVAIGASSSELKARLDRSATQWLHNRDWKRGMGSSIALAATHTLDQRNGPEALLFVSVDQPGVSRSTIDRLLAVAGKSRKGIVAASYNTVLGIPVIFRRRYFEQLAALSGDRGARSIVQAHLDDVVRVDCPEAAFDIDTPGDWANWQHTNEGK